MKKIIITILALVVFSLALMADMVTASKDGEKVAILQGHADRYNNQTNTWEFDNGARIDVVFHQGSAIIGHTYTSQPSITNGLGDFILVENSPSIFWYPGYSLDDVSYITYTYHGTQFTGNVGDSVLLEYTQGY